MMKHWKPGVLVILPVGIAGVNEVLRVHVVLGSAKLLLSKEFLADHRDTRSRLKANHASALTNVQSTVPRVTVRDRKNTFVGRLCIWPQSTRN